MHHNTVDINGVLMLERVAGQLPQLTRFTLYGISSMLVDSDWLQATSLVDIRSSKLRFISLTKTILAPRLFEVLLSLPRLRNVEFLDCVLTEPELAMNIVKKHQQSAKKSATVGISSLTIGTPKVNISWPAELLLELIACLPHLKSCTIYGDYVLRNAIKEKHPQFF
ncbi:hypothetical protein GQ42DRAFT_152436 [Ramicandelaber brevisporus]|nr:hypothetical protein GQ42DRAFT_152436 [Ramicandelaber brevisporus]